MPADGHPPPAGGRAPVWLGPVRPAGEAGDRQSNAYPKSAKVIQDTNVEAMAKAPGQKS
jgi:hypothetical protein